MQNVKAALDEPNETKKASDKTPADELKLLQAQVEALDSRLKAADSPSQKISLRIHKFLLEFRIAHRYRLKPAVRALTYRYLGDDTMLLLAIGMVPAIILPYFYDFQPLMLSIFDWINYFVLLAFLVEFVLKLYVSGSAREFFKDKWHILDFFILLLAGLEFLPLEGFDGASAAPLLRLLRVARVLAVAGRAAGRGRSRNQSAQNGKIVANAFDGMSRQDCTTLSCFNEHCCSQKEEWIDVQNISASHIPEIGQSIDMPAYELEKIISETSPGIDYSKGYTAIFLKDLRLVSFDERVQRIKTSGKGFAIVFARSHILTLSTSETDLFNRISTGRNDVRVANAAGFNIHILYCILSMKMKDYREIVNLVDRALEDIELEGEANPAGSRESALKDTFQLKKEINNVYYSLKRLQYIIESIVDESGKGPFRGMSEKDLKGFDSLLDDCKNIKANAENIKENLISLIDWHMNATSFEMNKVMKVLTMITCLAVVPAVITGFFGENILGSQGPFDITLIEVFILVAYVMSWAGLYAYIKGWFG
jgi:magnesium transporter